MLVQGLRTASTTDSAWVVHLGVFPTAIAFTTYAYALHHMTASQLGVTTYLVAPITVLLGWLTLDETPPTLAYAGGVLCLLGVALARSSRRISPAPESGIVDEPLVDVIAHPEAEERSA